MLEQIKALFGANFTLSGTPLEGAIFNYRSCEGYIEIIIDIYHASIYLNINESGIVTYTLNKALLLRFTLADISLDSIFNPLYEKSNVDNIIRLIGPLIIENQNFDFILKFEITGE